MKVYSGVAFRVSKFQIFGMKQHPVAVTAVPVQAVSDNWTAKTKVVSGMYTQLVGPSGEWNETDSGGSSFTGQSGPLSDAHFPVLRIVYLKRPVVGIKPEGESDLTCVPLDFTLEEGLVMFDNFAVHELSVQMAMALSGDSDYQQTGSVHVKAMNGRLFNHLRKQFA